MAIAVVIDWYGPYRTKKEFIRDVSALKHRTKCVYMGLGVRNKVHYVGLSESPKSIFANHQKLWDADNKSFFFGEIVSQGVGGRRSTKCRTDLKTAEHALIVHLKPKFNSHLKKRPLNDCAVIYSRFFDKDDYEKPNHPLPKFPKVIAYNWWSKSWDH